MAPFSRAWFAGRSSSGLSQRIETLATNFDQFEPGLFLRDGIGFESFQCLAITVDAVVDCGHAIPAGCKCGLDADIQVLMQGSQVADNSAAKALIAVVPEVPLSLN